MSNFFFVVLYKPLYNLLILITWLMPGKSVVLAIIILTILIRLLLLPSSLKAARLQVKNLELQPKINKIRAEIKDPKEQSEALMQLYKDENVSPFGSCLPLLIQLPVLIVLYKVFLNGLNTSGFANLYSFVPRPESINTMFMGSDLSKPNLWVLPIIAGVSQYILSYMMTPKTVADSAKNDPTMMMNKQMMYFLPLITILFGRSMPAALVIYWIITTIFSIGQQYYVNKEIKNAKSTGSDSGRAIIESQKVVKKKPSNKTEMIMDMMNKRLEKQAQKAGVNVTVRTKKRDK